jgi:hypothetical protein
MYIVGTKNQSLASTISAVCMYVCMYVWNKGIWKETINIGRYKILVIFPEIIQNKNFR